MLPDVAAPAEWSLELIEGRARALGDGAAVADGGAVEARL